MKRSIIISVALIVLFAMPVLASTPEQENAPLASEDELFLGEMSQLSEEELINIVGNIVNSGTQPDIYQEAGTQGRDEMLILLAALREANQKYWNPKVQKFVKNLLKFFYVHIPATCFAIFGTIPEGVVVTAQTILSNIGIDLTLTETANLLGLIAAGAYEAAVNLLINLLE